MTGYGETRVKIADKSYKLFLKSVNSRYFDLKVRLPKNWAHLEIAIRNFVGSRITRGTAEIWAEETSDPSEKPTSNLFETLSSFQTALTQASKQKKFKFSSKVLTEILIRNPEIWKTPRSSVSDSPTPLTFESLESGLEAVTADFMRSRKSEGEKLKHQFIDGLEFLKSTLEGIREKVLTWRAEWENQLRTRLQEVAKSSGVQLPSEDRILQEVLFLAEKRDVAEELKRIDSHLTALLDYFSDTTSGSLLVSGKKIEFLLQELHREWTTLGNKTQNPDISFLVVEAKLKLDQLKEQSLNIL